MQRVSYNFSFSLLVMIFLSLTVTCQETRLFENSIPDGSSDEELFKIYNDSIDKYLYRDTELTKRTLQACEGLLVQGISPPDSLLFFYKNNRILFKLAESDNVGAYQELLETEKTIDDKHLSPSMARRFKYLKGFTFMALGDLEAAQKVYYENIVTGKERKDTSTIISNLYSLGQLYSDEGDYEDAIKSYEESLNLYPEIHTRPSTVVLIYTELGETYNNLKDYEKAIKSLNKGINYADSEGLQVLKLDLLINKGNAFLNLNKIEEAEKTYLSILEIQEGGIDKLGEHSAKLYEANLYESKNQFDKAIEIYENLESKTDTSELNTLLLAYENLHLLNKKKGDYQAAYDYLINLQQVNSKIQNDEKRQKTAYLKVKYDTAKKEKNNQLLEAKLNKTNVERSLLYAFLAIIGLLLVVVFMAYFQKLRYNQLLTEEVANRTKSLNESNTLLKESNNELDEFNRILSHDLKEPVRNIVSFSQLAINSKDNNDHLNIVKESGKRLQRLLENVAEYREISNLAETNKIEFSTKKMIGNLTGYFEENYPEKKLIISKNTLPVILNNKELISLIFKILIENSIKFNTNNTITINIDYNKEDARHIFLVEDNGIGINQKYHDQVFRMFSRLNNQSDYKGSGLGLSIARKSAELINGKLTIANSATDKGTTLNDLRGTFAK